MKHPMLPGTQHHLHRRNVLSVFMAFLFPILLAPVQCKHEDNLDREELKTLETARGFYTTQKFDEAKNLLLPLSKKRPGSIEAGVLLARVLFFTREFQASEAALRDVIKHNEHSPYALLWLGKVIASDAKRQAEAAEIFRKILRDDPENFAAHYYLGRCLEADGKVEPALLEYERAAAVEYQVSKLHLHMGELFHKLSMEDRARLHFHRVEELNLYPEDVQKIKSATAHR